MTMDAAELTGRVLGGRYTLREKLGAGGWGAVYSAVQNDLGRPVAIKVLHMNVAVTTDGLARFEREAKAAAAFGHPNIAQVTDFQTNAGEPPFLVMELLTGGTLGTVLRREPKIPQARMAWIAHQVLSGLDVAHRAGIVHRDIKPDNVFLVSMPGVDDLVKLLDFGIAKLTSDTQNQLTDTGSMLGSPAFMAPEQIRSHHVDHRVDIYALGATMYFALAGRLAFEAPNVHGMLLAITEQRATPLSMMDPTIDPRLSAVVERAMSKDPAQRYGSAAEMRAALEPWVAGRLGQSEIQAYAASPPSAFAASPLPMSSPPMSPPPMTSPASAYAASPMPMSPPPMSPPMGSSPPMGPPMGQSPPMMAPAHAMTPPPVTQVPAKSGGPVVGLLVAIIGLLVVLVLGGGGAAFFYARSRSENDGTGFAKTNGSAPAVGATAAPATPSAAGSATGPAATTTVAAATAPKAGVGTAPAGGVKPGAATPSATASASAAPAATQKQMAGTRWRVQGGAFNNFDIEQSKASVMKMSGAIQACYDTTEFDPPNHEFTNFQFTVAPTGAVTSVVMISSPQHPKFTPCMLTALRAVRFQALPGGGTLSITFGARTKENQ